MGGLEVLLCNKIDYLCSEEDKDLVNNVPALWSKHFPVPVSNKKSLKESQPSNNNSLGYQVTLCWPSANSAGTLNCTRLRTTSLMSYRKVTQFVVVHYPHKQKGINSTFVKK